MSRIIVSKLILIFVSTNLFGQISPPLEIPINISGTFGELRNTHFHSGIDIKTKGKKGLSIYSINSGDIIRIRISKVGYGKSLYIKHQNGTISVYAHLEKFSKKIETHIKSLQYEKKTYEIEDFPKKGEFSINKGDVIGYSGNSGSSSGPHLHFELRDSNTNEPLNPLKLGFDLIDTIKPKIKSLKLYRVSNDGAFDFLKDIEIKKKINGDYESLPIKQSGRLGIGINYYDKQNNSYNKNGIYSIEFCFENKSLFNYKMDKITFNDKKFLKLMVDYENWYLNKNRIQKLFTHPNSKYSFLNTEDSNGVFTIIDNKKYSGNIKIEDFSGNKTNLNLSFEGIKNDSINKIEKGTIINSNYEYTFDLNSISVNFSKQTFYNSVRLNLEIKNDTLDLGKNIYPIRNPFRISFNVLNKDSLFMEKGFIAKINKNNKPFYIETKKEKFNWSIKANELSKYSLGIDTIAPVVKPINFKKNQWISKLEKLKLEVKDDISGIKSINGTINGTWILLEHDTKKNMLTYDLKDLKFKDGKHILSIKSMDKNENKSEFKTFFFKKY